MDNQCLQKQAGIFRALSSKWRLAIVMLLDGHEMSVNEITADLKKRHKKPPIDRTSVSKHLAILKKMAIVSCVGSGQKRIYRLDAACLVRAVNCTAELAGKKACPLPGSATA